MQPVTCTKCQKSLLVKYTKTSRDARMLQVEESKERTLQRPLCSQAVRQRFLVFLPEIIPVYAPPNAFVDHWWPTEGLQFYQCPERGEAIYEPRRVQDRGVVINQNFAELLRDSPERQYLHALLADGPISFVYVKEIWPYDIRGLHSAMKALGVKTNNEGLVYLP